jgi:hypothetical protein
MMDIAEIAGALARLGARALGTTLLGPAGGAAAEAMMGTLADKLGVPTDGKAIGKALETHPRAAEIVREVEAETAPAVAEAVNAYLRDVQDARATTVRLVEQGSAIAWGAPVVSVVVLVGFIVLSVLALRPIEGVRPDVVLYLLGAWQALAAGVVYYWVGSSAGSKAKDSTIASLRSAR